MTGTNKTAEMKQENNPIPSSCKLLFAMLSLPVSSTNSLENLTRASIACNHRLEVSPYSGNGNVLFVTRERAQDQEDEINRMKGVKTFK